MPPLSVPPVPDRLVPAFEMIRDMSASDYSTLYGVFSAAEPSIQHMELAELICRDSELDQDSAIHVIDAIISLVRIGYSRNVPLREAAAQVASSQKLEDASGNAEEFSDRLYQLSDTTSMRLQGKASVIGYEYSSVLLDARIFTDMRPIFGGDTDNEPEGVILSHTLKLEYIDSATSHNSIYIALDNNDLGTLIDCLERANEKSATLESILDQIGFANIKLGD